MWTWRRRTSNLGVERHFHGFRESCCDWRGVFGEGGKSWRGGGRLRTGDGWVSFLMLFLVFGSRRVSQGCLLSKLVFQKMPEEALPHAFWT